MMIVLSTHNYARLSHYGAITYGLTIGRKLGKTQMFALESDDFFSFCNINSVLDMYLQFCVIFEWNICGLGNKKNCMIFKSIHGHIKPRI